MPIYCSDRIFALFGHYEQDKKENILYINVNNHFPINHLSPD